MKFSNAFSALVTAAQTILPAMVPGASPLIAAGKSIAEAIGHLSEHAGDQTPEAATQARQALLDKVRAHSDATAGRLEGSG